MAAAYAALVSLFNDLELINNHPRHSFSFENKQIQSLLQIITFLIEFMESFDNAHGPSKDAARLLERPITRVAHAAGEVIESHVVNQIRSVATLDGKRRYRFMVDVQKAIEDMEFVRRKAMKVSKALKQPTYSATTASSSSTPLTSDKNSMVGFDDVLIHLLELLTGYPSSRQVIPIVGTGGIGKTTLAKNAFEHPLIVEHFDFRVWATISQEYVVEDILLRLLSRKKDSNSKTPGELREELHKKLYGRRYLIVLDDIWSVEAWDLIKSCCPDTSDGSRVVVTTRQSNVVDFIASSRLAMSFLDEDNSWDLFCKKAFGEHGCPVELEDVGKRIVKKCKGLPLTIVVVAGHLGKSSKSQGYWENAANNLNSVLNSKDNNIQLFDVLSFSYSHLPARLKPCFIYMGTCREDEEMYVPSLIQRWIAEGFLKPCEGKNLEEMGEDYLKDLIDRNLILCVDERYVGIHDVLRELCIKVALKEMFFKVVDFPIPMEHRVATPRAICREHERSTPLIRSLKWEEVVFDIPRSTPLVHFLKWKEDEQPIDLSLLRVLEKEDRLLLNEFEEGFLEADLQQLNLRHVIYRRDDAVIHKIYPRCVYLRSPLSLLWNLQTLVMILTPGSWVAPFEIWEMLQLRNLQVSFGIYLPNPPPADNACQIMGNLQTLWYLENFKFSEEACERIPNIKELRLRYCDSEGESLRSSSYYCLHNLGCFNKLESLELDFRSQSDGRAGLKFPSCL